jgi:glycosyltransferase involved in cell wall biosynthesis
MQLSVVIPAFSLNEELMKIALCCAKSFRDCVDEIVISEDADVYWKELHDISDNYLIHPRLGYTKNVNMGWKVARGEYVMQVSADCELLRGNPRDLCVSDRVYSPRVIASESDPPWGRLSGACWVAPRSVTDVVGMLDETTDWAHSPDVEYFQRLNTRNNCCGTEYSVVLRHAAASPGPFVRASGGYSGR